MRALYRACSFGCYPFTRNLSHIPDSKPRDLEVTAFEGVQGDRMVGGCAGQGYKLHVALGLARGRASRARNSAESSNPEHEQVTSIPPGSTSFMARTFRSKYLRLPGAISSRSGISLGGSRTTTPNVLPLTLIWRA